MLLTYTGNINALLALDTRTTDCTETFLEEIEQQLEDGDITEDEAVLLMQDFVRCK